MDKNAVWKWLVLALVTVFSLVVVLPPKEKIRLGLDLQGGSSFTVQIDQEKLRGDLRAGDPALTDEDIGRRIAEVMRDADPRVLEVLRNRIDALGVNEPVIAAGKDHRILIQIPGTNEQQFVAAEKSIQSAAFLEFRLVHKDNQRLTEQLLDAGRAPEGYTVVDMGGRKYYQRTREFDTVSKGPDYARTLGLFQVPDPAYAFMLQRDTMKNGGVVYVPCFVRRKAEMTGETLKAADVERDTMSGAVHVTLAFKPKGAIEFGKITSWYAPRGQRNQNSEEGRQLAIVLDGTLYSAPVIKQPITDGKAVITGDFSWSEAVTLRNILNAGSLPAPVKIIEKRMVGSTLGKDAIDSGIRAAVIGSLATFAFMLIYYTYCGLIANIALLLNIVLMPAGMILAAGILGVFISDTGIARGLAQLPVLTMPGIAGIVLSIGMAVDANVLIFERMREEFEQGKSARAAVAAGYDRAFLAIFDSNLTTLLTGAILFIFGSGPIRGFAITLSAGIIVSMFTALVVTRLIFNATVSETRTKPYRMLRLIGPTRFDFLARRKAAIGVSSAVIVVTLSLFAVKLVRTPNQALAVDFTGGATVTLSYDAMAPIEQVRAAVNAAGVTDAGVQYQHNLDGSGGVLEIKSGMTQVAGASVADTVGQALSKALPASGFKVAGSEEIGPQIGRELKRDAMWAMILAMVGMIVYITLRFEFGFSLGAIVALLHDVLVMLGIYTLMGRQVNLTIVAALLTIVGYSVNDTIVIFDRIREDLKLDQRRGFSELCNLAINQTLSRTLLTTGVTLLSVISLFIFGGGAINDFALAMMIGMVAGTYSTIFIATPVALAWYGGRRPGFGAAKKV